MRRALVPLVAVILTSHPVGMAARQAPASPSPVVAVLVTVLDPERRVVPGLTTDDLQILDNGKPQTIKAIEPDAGPLSVVLLLDTSGSMKDVLEIVKTAAETFVDSLAPDAMALVGGFADRTTFSPAEGFTTDRAALKAGLHQLPSGFPSGLYDAITQGIDRLASRPGRRAVVVMTDGEDTASRANPRTVATKAAASGVSIWSIGIVNEYISQGPQTFGGLEVRHRTRPDRALKSLSGDTGGGFVVLKSVAECGPALALTAQALARPYVVLFSPTIVDGKTHKLEVRMKSAGRTALAPKAYRAGGATPR